MMVVVKVVTSKVTAPDRRNLSGVSSFKSSSERCERVAWRLEVPRPVVDVGALRLRVALALGGMIRTGKRKLKKRKP